MDGRVDIYSFEAYDKVEAKEGLEKRGEEYVIFGFEV